MRHVPQRPARPCVLLRGTGLLDAPTGEIGLARRGAALDQHAAAGHGRDALTVRAAVLPLRRLHSGLPGDYVARLAVGLAALLAAMAARL
ncbi:hypothetical protein C2142_01130 [Streptomyces sp. CB01881]|nr:hypothetical protein C2142_01130 [Streptomyces sp. CB01881]